MSKDHPIEQRMVLKNIRIPEPLVHAFNEIHPQHGAWVWFFTEILRIYVELNTPAERQLTQAVTAFKENLDADSTDVGE